MKKIFYLLIVTVLLPAISFAAPVYKYTDSNGKVVYSSKPKNSSDKPAELPQIVKGDVKQPAQDIQTCKNHGGINCTSGADSDGSVICYDGFKGAVTRFNFSCTTPKLEILEISGADNASSFKVSVRNTSSVEAKGIIVKFKPEIGGEYKLVGASVIAGFESGDYVYKPLDEFHKFTHADPGQIDVSCANCP